MKRLIYIPLLFALLPAVLGGCRKDKATPLSIGLRQNYAVMRLEALVLECGVEAPAYQWIVLTRAVDGQVQTLNDTISTEKRCVAVFPEVGLYQMRFVLDDPNNHVERQFSVLVDKELSEYSPLALEVLSYRPAPGTFVNRLPLAPASPDAYAMRQLCEAALRNESGEPVTLGTFGGTIVLAFDHLVIDKPHAYDFVVKRDKTQIEGRTDMAVWVAYDRNKNGKPDDDEWYLLQSNREVAADALSVTYERDNDDDAQGDDITRAFNAPKHVKWSSSDGQTGHIPRLRSNANENPNYTPSQWLSDWTEPYRGICYKPRAEVTETPGTDSNGNPIIVSFSTTLPFLPYNQAPEGAEELEHGMDIAWAVDANGKKADLPGIHFVKIVTATHQQVPIYGGLGVSILSVRDLWLQSGNE